MAEKGDMKSWEFLLQKEGDRTWLPLENPTVEILEGRYRVVARTPCAKTEVDIYVSFVSSEDDPPKRRIQQRSHRANDDGLLAILPFTPFRPGRWELRCRPHVDAGETTQQWHSQIELQVLPEDSQGDDDLFGWDQPQDDALDSQVTATDAPLQMDEPEIDEPEQPVAPPVTQPGAETAPMAESASNTRSAAALDPATASDADIQRLAAEMSQMVMESSAVDPGAAVAPDATVAKERPPADETVTPSNLPSPGFTAASSVTSDSSAVVDSNPAMEAAEPVIAIALEEDVVMMDGDRRVTVQGQILRSGPSTSPANAPWPSELLLTIELRDPSTTEIWASYRESFRQVMAPLSFSSELQLPSACRTQLCLGNATLWQVEENGNLERLVTQDFNAMAAVDTLLDHARQSAPVASNSLEEGAVSNLQQQAASNFLVTKFGAKPNISKGNIQINTELLNLLKPTPRTAGGQVQDGSSGSASRPIAARPVGGSSLELPRFGNARPVALPLADSLADDLAQDLNANSGDNLSGDELSSDELALDSEAVASAPLEANNVESATDLAPSPTSDLLSETEEDNPFALPLDGDLASLEAFAVADGFSEPAPGSTVDTTAVTQVDDLGMASASDLGNAELAKGAPEQPSLLTGEFDTAGGLSLAGESAIAPVDEGALLSSSAGLAHEVVVDDEETIPPSKLAWMQPTPSEGVVDEDISVPAPELTVPEVELVKGDTVRIQVRVAQEPARLCARVWLLDCQSRTLLGEPQWITAFLPLGDDLMEANVDLVIPEGSIELQVEAIAVEPITQRESRKVSTRRKVSLGGEGENMESW